jgi:hypothetical protein
MTTIMGHEMPDSPEARLLAECELAIELAWYESMDDSPVHRLALAHPEIADELYEFFADVIEAEDYLDDPLPELAESARRMREAVHAAQAARAAHEAHAAPGKNETPKKTFLALLRDASDEPVGTIAKSMDLAADFLVDASDHGTKLPPRVREELVRRLRRVRLIKEIDVAVALASFDAPAKLRRAASRKGPYRHVEVTYRDLVERSSMSDEEKRYWLALA